MSFCLLSGVESVATTVGPRCATCCACFEAFVHCCGRPGPPVAELPENAQTLQNICATRRTTSANRFRNGFHPPKESKTQIDPYANVYVLDHLNLRKGVYPVTHSNPICIRVGACMRIKEKCFFGIFPYAAMRFLCVRYVRLYVTPVCTLRPSARGLWVGCRVLGGLAFSGWV